MSDKKVFDYHTIRSLIGIIACLFPFFCLIAFYLEQGGFDVMIPLSLSVTYHFGARDIFVGMLFIVGSFLIAYNGYRTYKDTWHKELVAAKCAGIFSFLIALFPTSFSYDWLDETLLIPYRVPCFEKEGECHVADMEIITYIHQGAAVLFILILFYFCVRFYTRSKDKINELLKNEPDSKSIKYVKRRNKTYFLCAAGMLMTFIIGVPAYIFKLSDAVVFYIEFFCLILFGWSWFTAGKTLFYSSGKEEEERISRNIELLYKQTSNSHLPLAN